MGNETNENIYTVIWGYDVLGKCKDLNEAKHLIQTHIEEHHVEYVFVKQTKIIITDNRDKKYDAWYLTYQYRTLYFATYFVIKSATYGTFIAKGL